MSLLGIDTSTCIIPDGTTTYYGYSLMIINAHGDN